MGPSGGLSAKFVYDAHRQHFIYDLRILNEVRPRKDHRGVDLISDALPFGRLWYGELNAVSNAIDFAKC
jgi:hypothetical protein